MTSTDIVFPAVIAALALLGWGLGRRLCLHGLQARGWLGRHASGLPRRIPADALWRRIRRRWPRASALLWRRIDPGRFDGLPLLLTVAAALYLLFLMAGLVEAVLEAEGMQALDSFVNAWLSRYHTPFLVAAFGWITDLGGTATLTAVSLVATGFFWVYRHARYIPSLWLVIAGSQAMTWLGKYAFARQRPEFVAAVEAHSPSFPSAHAAGAMAVYGFLAFALARELPGVLRRFHLVYWLGVVVVLIGFSRVYLSVHYVSDVALGFLLGAFWLLVGFAVHEHARTREGPP